MKNLLKISVSVFILLTVSFSLVIPNKVYAQTPVQNFGGIVSAAMFCTCSGNWWLVVGPPKPGTFTYNWTPQFANYMLPAPGVWTLGLYVLPIPCLMYAAVGCFTIPAMGTISPLVGTSI